MKLPCGGGDGALVHNGGEIKKLFEINRYVSPFFFLYEKNMETI